MNKKLPIYLDNASTTPLDKRVFQAMKPYFLEHFGNASSKHEFGKTAKRAIEKSRQQVAKIINADPNEIIFTSGSTEAINLAIKGFVDANSANGNHIITVKTEHKAVLDTCEYLESKGIEVTYLDVDENGLISIDELRLNIKENTVLICVMYVNNEIGVIQEIDQIGNIARENKICFFTDATQAVGKVPIDIFKDKIDMLCLSAHKMNGPKGIGALYLKNGISITPVIHGGSQERGLRSGTYNTPLIVGLGKTCELANFEFEQNIAKLMIQQQEIESYYESRSIGKINCKGAKRAPHITSVSLYNEDAEDFLLMKRDEFAASTGSACNTEIVQESHVYRYLNFEPNKTVRISYSIC